MSQEEVEMSDNDKKKMIKFLLPFVSAGLASALAVSTIKVVCLTCSYTPGSDGAGAMVLGSIFVMVGGFLSGLWFTDEFRD